jgi:hypothetical protein
MTAIMGTLNYYSHFYYKSFFLNITVTKLLVLHQIIRR